MRLASDLRARAQNLEGCKNVPGAPRKRVLRLVGDGGENPARCKGIEHAGGDANAGQGLRMGQMQGSNAEAARHHDHQRHRLAVARPRRQEQLAVDGDTRHVGRPADGLEVVAWARRWNVDIAAHAAVGKPNAAFAQARQRRDHGAQSPGGAPPIGRLAATLTADWGDRKLGAAISRASGARRQGAGRRSARCAARAAGPRHGRAHWPGAPRPGGRRPRRTTRGARGR